MTETPEKGVITISHTRAGGTLVEGSRKGDGVFELIRPHGFRFFRSLGQLGVQQSRDKAAQRWKINGAAAALREAGWTVEIEIDEDTRRSFAEAEAERYERAEDRTDRFGEYADNAAGRSEAAWKRGREIADGIPFGQPILAGHHSEGRARRDQKRIDDAMRTHIDEGERAGHWAAREKAAAAYKAFRTNPGVTLRRIQKLEDDARRVEKWLAGESAGGYHRSDTEELTRRKAELAEELAYWREVIADAERRGFKVWGPADFAKGDFVNRGGTWYQVLRVNKKTLSIPHIFGGVGVPVVRTDPNEKARGGYTIPYDSVQGWASVEDIARLEATEPEPEEARTECPHCVRVANGQKRFSSARGMCTVCGYAKPRNFKQAPAPAPEPAEHQKQEAERAPAVEEQTPAAETCPMCHSTQWHPQARVCSHCHHNPRATPTPAPAPAEGAQDWQEVMALVFIVSKNTRRARKRALWAMTRREAQAVCGDSRTSGRSYMLTWSDRPGGEGADWEWVPDNGSLDPVLEDLGITPRREWTAARETVATATA
ncbi:DUF3560 domain-containing protein [Streptomyces sp. NPDC058247]|uniref:DUF3560 domain-containing protein n=1 Tax=Streptomyces sp. NPDC058247 TaxID=3346401 RepID=UPI0036E2B697